MSTQRAFSSTSIAANRGASLQSKLPHALRFPLLVTLNLSLSALLVALSAGITEGELASVSRRSEGWGSLGGLVSWRVLELALGWWGGYDSVDLASLSLLSVGPTQYLLGTFYNISTATIVISSLINVLATYIPFRLLRPLSRAHATSNSPESALVPNKEIITDTLVQSLAAILASGIYSTTLFIAYKTYLTTYLVTYFTSIPTIEAAYTATPFTLFPLTLLFGLAAKSFIFTPTAASAPSLADAKNAAFNPATATLSDTFWYNVWGFSTRTKIAIKRTATLVLVSGVNTFVQTYVTIEGVEALGALAYSGVWAIAAVVAGTSLGIVSAGAV